MQRTLLAVILVITVSLIGDAAMAVEEPPFQSTLQEKPFEIRNYPALVVAEVTVTGDQKEAGNKGFRELAAYIFGANKRKESIAASPASARQEPSEKIAMTAPVTQTNERGEWVVRFTMPSGYTLDTLPEPNDARVHLREVPASRFAVIKFSGLAEPDDVGDKTAELNRWIELHHLRSTGPASLAQYNPPWTLWFLRRNEVMIPIED